MTHLITEPELMEALDCKQRAALERLLRDQGVRVLYGRQGRICTTLEAVNAALGIDLKRGTDGEVKFL